MATKRLRDIDLNIRVRSGVIHADASVTWTVPDVPEVPPQEEQKPPEPATPPAQEMVSPQLEQSGSEHRSHRRKHE